MEDDLDANVIKNTQLLLGKYVKRPPLSDKLLRKPPFRFLHDIVTSVLKSKGFFEGLFDESELISENVKDRESKILFLNKVISVVSLTTGKPLSVKPSKIVAGQEPAKTNELLQCLAQALENNLSSDEAVKQFKSGVITNNKKSNLNDNKIKKESVKPLKKNTETKKLTSRSSEKLVASEREIQPLNKLKTKDITAPKKESTPPKNSTSKISSKKQIEKFNQEGKKNKSKEQVNISDNKKKPDSFPEHTQQEIGINEDAVNKEPNIIENLSQPGIDTELPKSAVSQPEKQSADLNVSESISKPLSANKSMRIIEQTDRLEINKESLKTDSYLLSNDKYEIEQGNEEAKSLHTTHISEDTSTTSEDFYKVQGESSRVPITENYGNKDLNNSFVNRPSSVRPSSSRPGAPRIRDKSDNVINNAENTLVGKVNIISENTLIEEEEDTSIIIENNITEDHEQFQNHEHNNLVNQNSHLVQQILDSQREFTQVSGKTEIEWQFGTQKATDIFMQEMEQLKFSVQVLSRIANPLGKLLDHIQEDVEVMRQELQQWTRLYEETSKDLLVQKNANNEALLPFYTKLKQLTADMEEKHEKISDLKISIHKNDFRIEKLLRNGNVQ